eukprot:TRINITY_DN17858_c0_g1_i2.p1 TRINITY_DN17858_c0_g1~~TRINITY_DN17858_c0_g1_i2.p1  ORF type:complete len:243 (+),score=44.55 TRINITY_DN17858_c0_g1_i2:167-895(+)
MCIRDRYQRRVRDRSTESMEIVGQTVRNWMNTSDPSFNLAVRVGMALLCICTAAEWISPVAYGRFGEQAVLGLDPRVGWWLMELPCTLVFVYNFYVIGGPQTNKPVPKFLGVLFVCHYLYRGWLFPALMHVHGGSKNFDTTIALGSWVVTCTHGFLSSRWYASVGKHLSSRGWSSSWQFRVGICMYLIGMVMTVGQDHILRELRPCPDQSRYCIPRGGLFDYATCGQYLSCLLYTSPSPRDS